MKLAILSDLHDNYILWQQKILPKLKELNATEIIFCGDMCSPGMMKKMTEEFGEKIHLVFGNVDGDKKKMEELATGLPNLTIYGKQGEIELSGKKIAFVHFPNKARKLAESGNYHLVCYGHTHKASKKKINRTLLINPGTAGGLFAPASFMTYDLEKEKVTQINF